MAFDKKNVKVILFVVFLSILFFCGLQKINVIINFIKLIVDIMMPFIVGCAIAFVFNVPMKRIEKILPKKLGKIKRPIAYVLTLILLLGILAFALFVIIPDLSKTIGSLALQVPKAVESVKQFFEEFMSSRPEIGQAMESANINFDALGKQAMTILQNSASGILNFSVSIISDFIGGVFSAVISFMFSIYILMQKEKLARQAKQVVYSFVPMTIGDRLIRVMKMSNKTFSNFIAGQCLEALILGLMFFVVLSIFKFPYALLISVCITISALVPVIGAFIGCSVGCILIMMVNPMQSFVFAGVFLIIQQIEGNLVYPHVVGSSVGLPSIWVLLAVTLGAGLMGATGILIFIPISSVAYALFKECVLNRLKERKIPKEKYIE